MKKRFLGHGLTSNPSGFTLLELLISLTIIGVILVIIFGSLRIGARAWEKGEADVEAQQRERIVLDLVKRQIASVCDREIEVDKDTSYVFKGDEGSMAFMSRLPAVPATPSGMVYVKYVIKSSEKGGNMLAFYEQDVVSLRSEGVVETPDEADLHVLIPGAHRIEFDYLKQSEVEGDRPQWQEIWDPESDAGFPVAVRVTFQRNKATEPMRVIARIYAHALDKKNEIQLRQ
ncbi:MAG: prepilin-type N-terminal cleavage/methylation domain-containing protein [Deltaproteobacteria bacterium]|nr:prepilin-type N-terminal cleavage/methylation domain-containing protein [Deltaproteobacteria bacterium]